MKRGWWDERAMKIIEAEMARDMNRILSEISILKPFLKSSPAPVEHEKVGGSA
jgi:hypothetical protein